MTTEIEEVGAAEAPETLRETIEKAVDEAQSSDPTPEPVAKPLGPTTEPVSKPEEEASQSSTPQPKPAGAVPAGTSAVPAKAADQSAGELKPPNQWKPHVREKWNQLPREVQEEVLRRESDNLRLIGSVGQKIRLADEVSQHIQPFSERLQATGASHSEFLGDVFQTVKGLASGSPQQKAEIIANIVQSYGVDLRTLDAVLTQRVSAPPPDPRVIEERRARQAAEAQVAQFRGVQAAQISKSAAQTLDEFASKPENEFFNDVRDMMADLLESGRASSLDEAYTACIWANPDTRKILLSREAEQRAAQKGRRAAQARVASSSVHGTPRHAGNAPAQGEMSLRETIAAAMDAQEGA